MQVPEECFIPWTFSLPLNCMIFSRDITNILSLNLGLTWLWKRSFILQLQIVLAHIWNLTFLALDLCKLQLNSLNCGSIIALTWWQFLQCILRIFNRKPLWIWRFWTRVQLCKLMMYSLVHLFIYFSFSSDMKPGTMLVCTVIIWLKLWRRLKRYWVYHQILISPFTLIKRMAHLLVEALYRLHFHLVL